MNPVKITRDGKASGAAKRWLEQYPKGKNGIYEKLIALGSTPEPDAVDEIIGNDSWTHEICDACRTFDGPTQPGPWVMVGMMQDYSEATVILCRSCLADAVKEMG